MREGSHRLVQCELGKANLICMVQLSGTDQPPLPSEQLFVHGAAETYASQMARVVAEITDRLRAVDRPFAGTSLREIERRVDAVDLDRVVPFDAAVDELSQVYLDHAIWFHEPAYVAHLNCPVALAALAAEAIASAVNTSVDTWDQSTAGTLIERRLVDWTAGLIGFGEHADGVFTSGGSQSNLQAVLLAREHAAHRLTGAAFEPELAPRLRVLATGETHFSVQKAARLLGLGSSAVRQVATLPDGRMDPAALRAALHDVVADGDVPMAVVATAGTTDRGCVDPIAELAPLARQHDAWLHVDAAYGGGLLLSPTRRHLLDGIEHADSVTVDYHKSFFQPVASSAIVVRRGADLRHVAFHADYLNPKTAVVPNQVDKSLQTTRRLDALKLWLTLRVVGAEALGAMFDDVIDLAGEVHGRLQLDPDFETLGRSQLSTVLFRFRPYGVTVAQSDELNPAIRAALFDEGRAIVAGTRVDGRHWLKLTLLNPQATGHDLDAVIERVRRAGRRQLAEDADGLEAVAG